jgi:hypothetical protein
LDDDLWEGLAIAAERGYGTDRSSTLRALGRWFLRTPGATLPERPDAATAEAIRAEAVERGAQAKAKREAKRAERRAKGTT